jgi:hypothetical protein
VNTQQLWDQLTPLRSKSRVAYGTSPYVYVKDTETGLLRRQVTVAGTATAGGATTLTDGTQTWTTNAYASAAPTNFTVELISGTGAGQRRNIVSNTGTVLTVNTAWSVNPAAATTYAINGWVDDWFKVRVLDVARELRSDGGLVKYEQIRVEFSMEDAAWNNLG